MKKRLFEILDDMNQHDTAHGTKLVQVSGTFIKSDLRSKGTEILMGADAQASKDLLSDEVIPILLLINKNDYQKRQMLNQP